MYNPYNTSTYSIVSEVEQMYQDWLSGMSIRNIGKRYNLGRMSVFTLFRTHFGKDATNLRKQSLSRVVYQEYGDMSLATKASGSEGLFRTIRAEKSYSKHQTYEAALSKVVYTMEDIETPVNLNTYLYICEMTSRAIKHCQIHNARMALEMSTRKDCTLGDC
jgi:hypothetical protein